MPPEIFSDPAMRAIIAAVMVSDAPDDLKVPSVAAAWAVDGVLGIVPAAIAASQQEDGDRPPDIGKTSSSAADEGMSKDEIADIRAQADEAVSGIRKRASEMIDDIVRKQRKAVAEARAEQEISRAVHSLARLVQRLDDDPRGNDAQTERDLQILSDFVKAREAAEAAEEASGKQSQSQAYQSVEEQRGQPADEGSSPPGGGDTPRGGGGKKPISTTS